MPSLLPIVLLTAAVAGHAPVSHAQPAAGQPTPLDTRSRRHAAAPARRR